MSRPAAPVALVALALAVTPLAAKAQDVSTPFAGGYFGGTVGVPQTDLDIQDGIDVNGDGVIDADDATTAAVIEGLDFDGLSYGGQVGYNFRIGNFVAGPELALTGVTQEAEDPTGSLVGSTAVSLEIDYIARASLRGGYAWDRNLFYGSVGAAYVSGGAATEFSETGSAYGLGYERMVSDRAAIGVQVMQHDFDDIDGAGFDIKLRTFEARYNYRF